MENEKEHNDSEEDDYENFFLQPASSPYNIKEKLQVANTELFNDPDDIQTNRIVKLKFKEDLVDYEPDTEDDVNSIESYSETADYSAIEKEIQRPLADGDDKPTNNTNLCVVPEADTEDDVDEEICEEVVEYETKIIDNNYVSSNLMQELEILDDVSETIEPDSDAVNNEEETTEEEEQSVVPLKIPKDKKRTNSHYRINCRNDCIERFLDVGVDLNINRLTISERPLPCPMLKLRRRNCCERNPIKTEQKLPVYVGHKSEYGLSLEQLEKKERRETMIKLREQKRERISCEYRRRRDEQNEEIFCQWLKNVMGRRRREKEKAERSTKKCWTPASSPSTSSYKNAEKVRPKTANAKQTGERKSKRPNTSNSCVYIEVPQRLLRRGVNLGDIFVRNAPIRANALHFLSV